MKTATYSLLTIRPDAERIDTLCVGAVVHTSEGAWQVLMPGAEKLSALGHITAGRRLPAMAANLLELLQDCESTAQARQLLTTLRSTLSLHEFEGVFAYETDSDYSHHIQAITGEAVLVNEATANLIAPPKRPAKPRVRTRLRRQFKQLGILAGKGESIADHKIVTDFPISMQHGLKAEFALKNGAMHITETVDFDVAEEGVRTKRYEAQAKCLVMRAAQEQFGPLTQRYIVIHGGSAAHASRSVDLLSTAGTLFASESSVDMTQYIDLISKAAGATHQIGAHSH